MMMAAPPRVRSPWAPLEQASTVRGITFGKGGPHKVSGTIKKLVAERGFGFITAEDGNDYFFHRSGTVDFDRLDTGIKVSFVTEPSPKGPRATNVRIAA
jgi:CspA family cold shock protein